MRRVPNFDRAISMICALRPTFMKSTPVREEVCVHTMIEAGAGSVLVKLYAYTIETKYGMSMY